MPTFRSIGEALTAIRSDTKRLDGRARRTVAKVARELRNTVVRDRVPRDFGELATSIHVDDRGPGRSDVVADAPHAAAVEVGSRPHMPPLAPLVKWVTLRGLQGLTAGGGMKRARLGPLADPIKEGRRYAAAWRRASAEGIASSLRKRLGRKGAAWWKSNALAVSRGHASYVGGADPDTLAIARAIQQKIARVGTKPTRFMQSSTGDAHALFDRFMKSVRMT